MRETLIAVVSRLPLVRRIFQHSDEIQRIRSDIQLLRSSEIQQIRSEIQQLREVFSANTSSVSQYTVEAQTKSNAMKTDIDQMIGLYESVAARLAMLEVDQPFQSPPSPASAGSEPRKDTLANSRTALRG
jgi:hypothetical protein